MSFFLKLKNSIPNTLTICNLLSGCLSIVASFEGFPVWSGVFILIAATFDFLDGLMARILKAYSDIGKELDSLADIVSFGLAPAVILFNFLKSVLLIQTIDYDDLSFKNVFILMSPFIITAFSAIRLAKFNIDNSQQYEFRGLPTPANAIFIAWLPFILSSYNLKSMFIILNINSILLLIFIHSFLLVSNIPLFSLKLKSLKWADNKLLYIFLIVAAVLVLLLKMYSVPIIIWIYILIGILRYLSKLFVQKLK